MRSEVIDARRQVRQVRTNGVDVDVVERARARGGAKENLAAGIRLAAEHARREVEQARERSEIERGTRGFHGRLRSDGVEREHP